MILVRQHSPPPLGVAMNYNKSLIAAMRTIRRYIKAYRLPWTVGRLHQRIEIRDHNSRILRYVVSFSDEAIRMEIWLAHRQYERKS